jgi:hypothetical protein
MHLPAPQNPLQPLDDRWLRAGYLAKQGQHPSPEHDDHWVEQAVQYLTALAACHDDADRQHLAAQMPAVAQAHALHQADPPLLRWAVEARVLADEPAEDIARKCNLLPGGVEAYENLFFDVRDKLGAESWVLCQAIGLNAHAGLTELDLGVRWKLVGYKRGPLALDALIGHTAGRPWPESPEALGEALAAAAESLLGWKKLLAAHLQPVTPAPQIRPIEPSLSLVEVLGGIELKPWRFAPDDGGDRHPETPPAAAGDTAAGQRGGRRDGRQPGAKRGG